MGDQLACCLHGKHDVPNGIKSSEPSLILSVFANWTKELWDSLVSSSRLRHQHEWLKQNCMLHSPFQHDAVPGDQGTQPSQHAQPAQQPN